MDNTSWFDRLMENCEDALWIDPTRDPAALAEEIEEKYICDTGYNFGDRRVSL